MFTVLIATAVATTATPATASSDSGAADSTRALFTSIADDVPGCTVAVAREGAIVFAEAYGAAHLDPLEPMTVDTVVDIGSTSKQFTATAILLLAERGEIDLEAPLSTYLPDLPAWAGQPTIAQLMHHESGIPDYVALLLEQGFTLTEVTTTADALAALSGVGDLDFSPGTEWAYSNSNYFLLSEVVRSVTGQDLAQFLDAEVFTPLKLDMVMDPVAAIPAKAVSYQRNGEDWQIADSPWEQIGDGAIQTTPSDLVLWASQYWNPTVGSPGINEQRMAGAVESAPGARYGAGIVESDIASIGRVLTHSGAWAGFVTIFAVAPEAHVATALTCTSPDTAMTLDITTETDLLALWLPPAG